MKKGLTVLGFLVVAGAVSGAWDDGLKEFQKKAGVSGADACAGIPRHPAVVNPPVRAEGTPYLSLAGEWEFIMRRHGASSRSLQEIQHGIRWGGQRNKWFASSGTDVVHKVTVPGCWEANGIGARGHSVSHLCRDNSEHMLRNFYAGSCWYRKVVKIPADWAGSRLWLKVGGVRSRGWFYVNGHAVALFDAGVGAWKWEITDFVKPGEEALVMANVDNEVAARGGLASSKNRWGGLVRDVELEATPQVFIDDAWVRGDFDMRLARVEVEIEGGGGQRSEDLSLRATVEGETVQIPLSTSTSSLHLEVPLRNFRAWSPAHPNLYTAKVELVSNGEVVQTRLERFGVRKLEVRGKDLYLNGKPFCIRGCGDNFVYPKTGVSPADKDFHLAHLKLLRSAGFNYIRMHTHFEQPEYFDAADEAGVILAPELAYYSDECNDYFDYDPLRDAYDAYVAFRRNVSFAVRGCGNEGLAGPGAGYLLYRLHKWLDPNGLAIEQDGGSYLRPDWGKGATDFAGGPLSSWRRGAIDPPVPMVAHEYMNLAAKADCRDADDWNGVIEPPMTRAQRRAHLEKAGLSDEWLDRLQDSQHALQKYWQKNGVEAARADPFCDGYVFWTIADTTVFNAAAGVYTAQGMFSPFWRPKRAGTTFADAAVYNSPSCLLIDNDGPADRRGEPYPDELVFCASSPAVRESTNRVYAAGEEFPLDFMLSHYDEDLEIADGTLTWRFVTPDGATLVSGTKSVGAQARGPMRILARERIRVPAVSAPTKATLVTSLSTSTSSLHLSNFWDFWFFPKAEKAADPAEVVIADFGSAEADAARRAGKNLLVIGNRSEAANFVMGWWWLGKQVGTAVKRHACLGDFPYEPFLSPLLFRVIKEGEALPVAGYEEDDYVIVGEGQKDAYLYLAAKERPDGGREVYVSGLDISGATPESAALRANLMRWLARPERRASNALSRAAEGFASKDPRVRRFALNELFEKNPAAGIAKAKTMTGDPDEIVQLYLVNLASSIKDKTERTAFIGEILEKSTFASVVKEAERRGGFPFFRNNVAKSKDPANDHDLSVITSVPLPTDGWAFATDPKRKGHFGAVPFQDAAFADADWKRIRIGDCWEKQGFDGYDGVAWYRVTFTLPEKPAGTLSSELCFDAVDEEAWVWLNGTYLGQHAEGTVGWDIPFRFGADAELKWGGENTLVVRVGDSTGAGGIWKGVRVEALK